MGREISRREIAAQLAADRAAKQRKAVEQARAVAAKARATRRTELTREIAALKKVINGKKPFPAGFREYLASCEQELRRLK